MRKCLWDSLGSFFFHEGYFFLSQNSQILQNLFAYSFELTERLRHTDITERYCYRRVLGDGCWVLMISHRGISVITPLPPGEGSGEGPLSLWAFVCSVLLCSSVRNRTHPRYEITHKQHAGEFFLSCWWGFSLTEHTDLTEHIFARSELTERLRHTENTERYC